MATPDLTKIRMLVLDVDGILTDGTITVDDEGRTTKRYSIIDGAGIVYWQRAGHGIALISGHGSQSPIARFRPLGVEEIHVGVKAKIPVFEDVLARRGVTAAETAVMGDDLMDLGMLRRAGFAATVANAHTECRALAHYVASAPAGAGAVREVIELILRAQGRFELLTERERA